MTIGEMIKKWRKEKGFTQKQLAEAAGIATITIQQYEGNKRVPKAENLARIAQVLEITERDFWEASLKVESDGFYEGVRLLFGDISSQSIKQYAKVSTEYVTNRAKIISENTGIDVDTVLSLRDTAKSLNLLVDDTQDEGMLFTLSTKFYGADELQEIFNYIRYVESKRPKDNSN